MTDHLNKSEFKDNHALSPKGTDYIRGNVSKSTISCLSADSLSEIMGLICMDPHFKEVSKFFTILRECNIEGRSYFLTPIIEGKGAIMFFMQDSKLKSRYFRKSYSEGGWRAVPNQVLGVASKGEGTKGFNYSNTTKVSHELEQCFYEDENFDLTHEQFKKLIPGIFSSSSREFIEETKVFDDEGVLEHLRMQDGKSLLPGEWALENAYIEGYSGVARTGFFHDKSKLDVTSFMMFLDFPEGFVPDFTRDPIRGYEKNHTIAGSIGLEVFLSMLGDREIEWHMAYDKQNDRVWIDNVRLHQTTMNSFGVDSEFINPGLLVMKPFEYVQQLPEKIARSLYRTQSEQLIEDSYLDITSLIAGLSPIRNYRKSLQQKGLREYE